MQYKIGDTVERKLLSTVVMSGLVSEVSDDIIACIFIVDQPRTMRFYKSTGFDVLGREFGSYKKV